MNKMLFAAAVCVVLTSVAGSAFAAKKTAGKAKAPSTPGKSFSVYSDQGAKSNHFVPSGWMGDCGDIKLNAGFKEGPQAGTSCIMITYSAESSQNNGWSGVYWQYPANNWGNVNKGYNLTGVKKLTFWARGEKGDEEIAEFKVGGISGEYADSDSTTVGPVKLTKEWKQYTIDLDGKDLSHVIGGFCWTASKDNNPEGVVFYLDEIAFE